MLLRDRRWVICALCSIILLTAACTGTDRRPRTQLAVFAASSLTEAFAELEAGFERANPDIDVVLTFSGSQVLRLQIAHGAHADVFASANAAHVRALEEQGLVSHSRVFAHNEPVVITPLDGSSATSLRSFTDLPRARNIVIGADNVPIGVYTREILQRATDAFGRAFTSALSERIVSHESNVRLVRAKVELGEADAAIVYRTDALASNRVRTISIPASINVHAEYHIGLVHNTSNATMAQRWLAFMGDRAGHNILARHGFTPVQVRTSELR